MDPAILLALWLLATIDGVGSAREVGVNHHLLSALFESERGRSARPERLEALMVQVLAVLMDQGLVSLNRVAQDGVRTSAGGSSFRRQGRLEEHRREAQAQVEALKN